jgi:hypothetical protein
VDRIAFRVAEIAITDARDGDFTCRTTGEVSELDAPDHSLAANDFHMWKSLQLPQSVFHDSRNRLRSLDDFFLFEDVECRKRGRASQRMTTPCVRSASIVETRENVGSPHSAIDGNAVAEPFA